MHTAVAFFIFNRPGTTEQVFAAIAKAQPPVLLVVADGPRPDRVGEAEKCAAARAVIERVDWPCDVRTNFANTNLGLKRRMSSGITWVFEQVEEAIILEDDIVPDPTFFRFCEELLDKYRYDTRVGYISGNNVLLGARTTPYSYYFTSNLNGWGWASWRRAWQYYDVEMKLWPAIRDQGQLPSLFNGRRFAHSTTRLYELCYRGEVDIWDVQWEFACRTQNMMTITPSVPLVKNIGIGADSTTTIFTYRLGEVRPEPMSFPLAHPLYMLHNVVAEKISDKTGGVPLIVKLINNTLHPRTVRRMQNIVRKAMAARARLLRATAKRTTVKSGGQS